MNIAFCYENVLPERGGCETYIADLARRLVADGHEVHLYACRWNAAALPADLHYHRLTVPACPRFLRPWFFGAACKRALRNAGHQVTIGFDKTWGQDVLYPQGGLHAASAEHNLNKHRQQLMRGLARLSKWLDLAHWSYTLLERRQYLGPDQPLVVAISDMTRQHFERHYGIAADELRVVYAAIAAERFDESDRLRRRSEQRQHWQLAPDATVAAFMAMNYRLKGLEPLLHAVARLPRKHSFCLLVLGHPRTASYERLARRLGITDRVRFGGYCADARNAYFAADYLVHPTFYDPCSLVVLEALACGLPVITSQFNGVSALLTNLPAIMGRGKEREPADLTGMERREGYVIRDPHDHGQMAWCLERLLDPRRRADCAQAARRTAAQWTFSHHYQALLQVFAEAAARSRAA